MKGYNRRLRADLRLPGRLPEGQRENCRRFWIAIASGCSSEDAAVKAGVSPAVGVRWFGGRVACPDAFLAVVKTSIRVPPFAC